MGASTEPQHAPDGDLFELLYPVEGVEREFAQRWTQLLALLVGEARAPAPRHEALAPARRALATADRELALDALDDLLTHGFDALLDEESWFALARPSRSWHEAWAAFARAAALDVAPPAPGENPEGSVEVWVAGFEQLAGQTSGVKSARLARRAQAWRLVLVRALEGSAALAALLEPALPRSVPHRIATLEARALLALERGDPRGAREVLASERSAAALDPALAELTGVIERLVEGLGEPLEWNHAAPAGLIPFVRHVCASTRRTATASARSRRSVGASFLLSMRLEGDGRARPVAHEAAPALEARVAAFARLRAETWRSPEAPERLALETSEIQVRRGLRLEGVLARESVRAAVLVPLECDAGWLHLEFEHGLVPSEARLRALATAWSRAGEEEDCDGQVESAGSCAARRAFAETAGDAWFDLEAGGLRAIAGASGSVSDEHLERAVQLGFGARVDGAEIRTLLWGDRTIGLVVGAEPRVDLARLTGWQDARFADWHRASFGAEVEPVHSRMRLPGHALRRLAGVRSSLELVGPAGSGKEVVARRLHFERDGVHPFVLVCCGDELELELGRSEGAIVCDEPGRWPRREQLALATAPVHRRLIALVQRPLAEGIADGGVEPALAARFARLSRRVAALADERSSIAPITDALLESIAAREGWTVPTLDDEARALLWRQPWRESVRGLEAALYRALLQGEELSAATLAHALRAQASDVVERLPTNDARAFEQALQETQLANGRENKRRAALYLGWDRDTVAARCREDSSP